MSGDIVSCLSRGEVLVPSTGQKPGVLLNILLRTGKAPDKQTDVTPNVNSAELEKP